MTISIRKIEMGCDPEFFFKTGKKIIGAEKVISTKGIKFHPSDEYKEYGRSSEGAKECEIVIDGVQAELHPKQNWCIAHLQNEIACCFKKLNKVINDSKNDVSFEFGRTVTIDPEELMSLDESSRKFGCAPSWNTYSGMENSISVDPIVYRKRSGGGHIHMGRSPFSDESGDDKELYKKKHQVLVRIMDIVVGNTCVLLDTDKDNKERRKYYGLAGDYRLPPHGLEYRTLSNFWLTDPALTAMVFGLARMSYCIVFYGKEKDYLNASKETNIVKAINKNDYSLAMENYLKIRGLLFGDFNDNYMCPVNSVQKEDWDYFIKMGYDHWFTGDPLKKWLNFQEGHSQGFNTFLVKTVGTERIKNG
jgi:hypothetical protein